MIFLSFSSEKKCIRMFVGGFVHWVSRTNIPRQVTPGGYRLKWYVVLQFKHHQFLFGQDTH